MEEGCTRVLMCLILHLQIQKSVSEYKYVWKQAKWEDYKNCEIQDFCNHSAQVQNDECESEVGWENLAEKLEDAERLIIIDLSKNLEATTNPAQLDGKQLKEDYCDIAFVSLKKDGCLLLYTTNRCPWIATSNDSIADALWYCEHKGIENPDHGQFPKSCNSGAGWNGSVETVTKGVSYKINWVPLVKQPRCVNEIMLIDKKAKLKKTFLTTWRDTNFPIRYLKTTCDLTVVVFSRTHDDWTNIYWDQCMVTTIKVSCAEEELGPRYGRGNDRAASERDVSSLHLSSAAVVAVTLIVCSAVIVIAIMRRGKRQKTDRRQPIQEEEESNNLYGTYHHGVEYNLVVDNNDRYNEDVEEAKNKEHIYCQL